MYIVKKKRQNRHKTHTWVRIVLNVDSRHYDGETSESDKRRRLFNYHQERVAETFVCDIFSGRTKITMYLRIYVHVHLILSLSFSRSGSHLIWLNGGSELFRLNRSSMRENEPLSVHPDIRRYLHCQEDRQEREWISARSNTWVRYTRLNAIFQFTLIDPPSRPEAKAAHISRIKRSRFSLLRQIRRGALLNGIFAIRIKGSVNLMESGKNKCATVRYPSTLNQRENGCFVIIELILQNIHVSSRELQLSINVNFNF